LRLIFVAALIVSAVPAFSMEPIAAPQQRPSVNRKVRRHRRVAWNPVFRPSRESLLLQNAEVDRMELPRIQDDFELESLKSKGDLVEITTSEHLRFDPRLDPDRRYCRPWARDFVEDLSKAYYEAFGAQIQVNSAVRTVKIQKKLRRHNRNAAPEKGELASSHLAGTTVDLQRRGMTPQQIAWMQKYMMPLKELGLIEPEEERRQWVFHIMVSDKYAQTRDDKPALAVEQPKFVNQSEASSELASAQ
jgi:DNA-directed RNA polymerase subunit H (RpoH/RPB5)